MSQNNDLAESSEEELKNIGTETINDANQINKDVSNGVRDIKNSFRNHKDGKNSSDKQTNNESLSNESDNIKNNNLNQGGIPNSDTSASEYQSADNSNTGQHKSDDKNFKSNSDQTKNTQDNQESDGSSQKDSAKQDENAPQNSTNQNEINPNGSQQNSFKPNSTNQNDKIQKKQPSSQGEKMENRSNSKNGRTIGAAGNQQSNTNQAGGTAGQNNIGKQRIGNAGTDGIKNTSDGALHSANSVIKNLGETTTTMAAALSVPAIVVIIVLSGILLVSVFILIPILGYNTGTKASATSYEAGTQNLSAEVLGYQGQIENEAKKYDMEQYVPLLMAIMMQESGGRGSDPMQASECSYNTKYSNAPNSITDPAYSIECGVHVLVDMITDGGITGPKDLDNIRLALQGYNYGNGFVAWARSNGGWTQENAFEFQKIHSNGVPAANQDRYDNLGPYQYGDAYYTDHVLRYYNVDGLMEGTKAGTKGPLDNIDEGLFSDWWGYKEEEIVAETDYVEWMKRIAEDDTHGYSMSRRTFNPDVDCSSFIYYALINTQYTEEELGSYPFTTMTMGSILKQAGFKEIAFSSSMTLKKGDILVNTESHTEVYIGDDQNVGAHSDYDNVPGDSSGREVSVGAYYIFSRGWDYVYRP